MPKKAIILTDETVMDKIYTIRKQKVMLDKDLAELYGVKPIRLREQVKRNLVRFPKLFMFKLSKKEAEDMVSQNAIPSKMHMGGALPYAFTEHGVLMLANILKSKRAIEMSMRLIVIFLKMREMLSLNKDILLKLAQLEKKTAGHDHDIKMIFTALKQLLDPPKIPRPRVGYRRSNESD